MYGGPTLRSRRAQPLPPTVLALSLALVAPALAGLAAPAAADHNGSRSLTCTYALANGVAQWTLADGNDRWMDLGGCRWVFPDSGGEEGGLNPQRTVDGEWTRARVSMVVDDVWGVGAVGVVLCNDGDGDGACGETDEGEMQETSCGGGAELVSTADWDGDGHDDLGTALILFINGPVAQALRCDLWGAPGGGTTGGVLDPTGGAFVELEDGEA